MHAYTAVSFCFSAFGAVVLILCMTDAIPREATLVPIIAFGFALAFAVAGIISTK